MPNYGLFSPMGDSQQHFDLLTTNPMSPASTVPSRYGLQMGQWYQSPNYQATERGRQRAVEATLGTGTGAAAPTVNPATGRYQNPDTGMPFNGYDPTSGRHYVNGLPVTEPVPYSGGMEINPNDPNQRYQPVNRPRNPEMNPVIDELTRQLEQTANDSLDNFANYRAQFSGDLNTARSRSAAATDIGPLSADLIGQQRRYASTLDRSAADYANLNAQTAANTSALVAEGRDIAGPQTDQAVADAMNYQGDILQRGVSRYKASTGTPRGLGSSEQRMLTGGAAAIAVPMEQFRLNQRQNLLQNLAMPAALDTANRETQRIATFNPMVAAQQFQTGTATAQTIHQLAMEVAQRSKQDAIDFMRSISVPSEIQIALMSGNIGQAIALNKLRTDSQYQGLHDVLGASITPSVNTQFVNPGYPAPSRYTPGYSGGQAATQTGTLGGASNAPRTVSPTSPPDTSGNPYGYAAPTWANQTPPTPTTYAYDPDMGSYYNRYTGSYGNSSVLPGESGITDQMTNQVALEAALGTLGFGA